MVGFLFVPGLGMVPLPYAGTAGAVTSRDPARGYGPAACAPAWPESGFAVAGPWVRPEPPRVLDLWPAGPETPTRPEARRSRPPAPRYARVAAVDVQDAPAATASYRPLLPEPGRAVRVRFGDVASVVAAQLEAPFRLRPDRPLLCRVQVYEVAVPQRISSLARAVTGGPETVAQFARLSPELAAALGAPGTEGGQASDRRYVWRAPDAVLPGERVLRLVVLEDPTSTRVRNDGAWPVQKAPTAEAEGRVRRILRRLKALLPRRRPAPRMEPESWPDVEPEVASWRAVPRREHEWTRRRG